MYGQHTFYVKGKHNINNHKLQSCQYNQWQIDGWKEDYVLSIETEKFNLVDNYFGEVPIKEVKKQN